MMLHHRHSSPVDTSLIAFVKDLDVEREVLETSTDWSYRVGENEQNKGPQLCNALSSFTLTFDPRNKMEQRLVDLQFENLMPIEDRQVCKSYATKRFVIQTLFFAFKKLGLGHDMGTSSLQSILLANVPNGCPSDRTFNLDTEILEQEETMFMNALNKKEDFESFWFHRLEGSILVRQSVWLLARMLIKGQVGDFYSHPDLVLNVGGLCQTLDCLAQKALGQAKNQDREEAYYDWVKELNTWKKHREALELPPPKGSGKTLDGALWGRPSGGSSPQPVQTSSENHEDLRVISRKVDESASLQQRQGFAPSPQISVTPPGVFTASKQSPYGKGNPYAEPNPYPICGYVPPAPDNGPRPNLMSVAYMSTGEENPVSNRPTPQAKRRDIRSKAPAVDNTPKNKHLSINQSRTSPGGFVPPTRQRKDRKGQPRFEESPRWKEARGDSIGPAPSRAPSQVSAPSPLSQEQSAVTYQADPETATQCMTSPLDYGKHDQEKPQVTATSATADHVVSFDTEPVVKSISISNMPLESASTKVVSTGLKSPISIPAASVANVPAEEAHSLADQDDWLYGGLTLSSGVSGTNYPSNVTTSSSYEASDYSLSAEEIFPSSFNSLARDFPSRDFPWDNIDDFFASDMPAENVESTPKAVKRGKAATSNL